MCRSECARLSRQCAASSLLVHHTLPAELSRFMCHAHYVVCPASSHATHIMYSVKCTHMPLKYAVTYISMPHTLCAVSSKPTFYTHYVLHGAHLEHADKI